ncbi:MAG: hypothetical protein NDJ90_10655 [Oligoflexia bacterium]|nr:hypothetical protein [Oligoflexia bacterium]
MSIRFTVLAEKKEIFVDSMSVSGNKYKGKGYSHLVFGRMLRDFPETQVVSGEMGWDNETVLLRALPGGDFHLASREEQERAVMATPFYRSLSKFGFSEWDPTRIGNSLQILVVLRRPSSG